MTRAAPGGGRHRARHRRPRPGPAVVLLVHISTALLVATAVVLTVRDGFHEPGKALAFATLIVVGELTRCAAAPGGHETAPLGAAGALAYALLGECGGTPTGHGVLQVTAVVAAGALAGAVPRLLGPPAEAGPALDHAVRRVLCGTFAAVCFQPIYNSGELVPWARGASYALFLLVLTVLTALYGALLAAFLLRARTGFPYGALLRDELRALPGIGTAVCATGAVIALAVAVAGLWALPVFCVPLLLTQLSFRRYEAVRAVYRQTIASLSRSTEIAGYTPPGHSRRVAALSCAVGRELRLTGQDLTVLEYAALMHDIGQLSLVDPVPAGATAPLPAAEQRRIARLGGAVVRQTGVPAEVAVVVERQADPCGEQPLPARIVRAVNAYDDLAADPATGPSGALERLRHGSGREYQREVVEALARVLARGGPGAEGPWQATAGGAARTFGTLRSLGAERAMPRDYGDPAAGPRPGPPKGRTGDTPR